MGHWQDEKAAQGTSRLSLKPALRRLQGSQAISRVVPFGSLLPHPELQSELDSTLPSDPRQAQASLGCKHFIRVKNRTLA